MLILAARRARPLALLLLLALCPAAAIATTTACPGKVAFIGLNADYDLGNAQPLLEQLNSNGTYPVSALEFHYLSTPLDLNNVDAVADELEAQIVDLKNRGFYRIGLPPRSTLLAPFIDGSAGSLGGIDIDTRHRGIVFAVANPGTPAVDSAHADSVFRFLDVPTLDDIVGQVEPILGATGTFLIVYQQGDAVSESVRDSYIAAATALGRSYQAIAVPFIPDFDPAALATARTAVLALNAGSLVVHIVDGFVMDTYTTDALAADLFVPGAGVRHVGGNFVPSQPLPVDFELGQNLVWNPSQITEDLGLPTKYEEWINDPVVQSAALYLEEYAWMATCGTSSGLLDGFLAFDAGGTSIQFQRERIYYPAGTLTFTSAERSSNPRWYSDQVPVDTATLFDHVFFNGFE